MRDRERDFAPHPGDNRPPFKRDAPMTALPSNSARKLNGGQAHYGWTTDGGAVLQEVGTAPTGTKVWPQTAAK
jgi:hypothetical protein